MSEENSGEGAGEGEFVRRECEKDTDFAKDFSLDRGGGLEGERARVDDADGEKGAGGAMEEGE